MIKILHDSVIAQIMLGGLTIVILCS